MTRSQQSPACSPPWTSTRSGRVIWVSSSMDQLRAQRVDVGTKIGEAPAGRFDGDPRNAGLGVGVEPWLHCSAESSAVTAGEQVRFERDEGDVGSAAARLCPSLVHFRNPLAE